MAFLSHLDEKLLPRWWMGGAAAAMSCCFTQSLDTLKVQKQMFLKENPSALKLTLGIIKEDGILALNAGLSAAILRQLTYSTLRFALYEKAKNDHLQNNQKWTLTLKIFWATVGGSVGGLIGTPADIVNVRMQNDSLRPINERRRYKHAIDGIIRIIREEGYQHLFRGGSLAVGRSILMTIGQLTTYDVIKNKFFIQRLCWKDNIFTHFSASFTAGVFATAFTQPLDVLKTLRMDQTSNSSLLKIVEKLFQSGPKAFFKGFSLRLVRIAPHTILTFVFFEQLRQRLGYSNS